MIGHILGGAIAVGFYLIVIAWLIYHRKDRS